MVENKKWYINEQHVGKIDSTVCEESKLDTKLSDTKIFFAIANLISSRAFSVEMRYILSNVWN